jgi:hypothetical protein
MSGRTIASNNENGNPPRSRRDQPPPQQNNRCFSRPAMDRGRTWISCTADRSLFHIRSASPSLRYSARRSRTPSPVLVPSAPGTDSWDTQPQPNKQQGADDSSSTKTPPPTLSAVRRVRSFSSGDRQPWREIVSPVRQRKDDDEVSDDDSDIEASGSDFSFPSDDGSLKSASQLINSAMARIKGIGRGNKSKCSTFDSDAAPFQVRRRNQDVLLDSSHQSSYRSLKSEAPPSLFTPSVKKAATAIQEHDLFSSDSQKISHARRVSPPRLPSQMLSIPSFSGDRPSGSHPESAFMTLATANTVSPSSVIKEDFHNTGNSPRCSLVPMCSPPTPRVSRSIVPSHVADGTTPPFAVAQSSPESAGGPSVQVRFPRLAPRESSRIAAITPTASNLDQVADPLHDSPGKHLQGTLHVITPDEKGEGLELSGDTKSVEDKTSIRPPPPLPRNRVPPRPASFSKAPPKPKLLPKPRAFRYSSNGSLETGPPSPLRERPPHEVASISLTPERLQPLSYSTAAVEHCVVPEVDPASLLPSAMIRSSIGGGSSCSSINGDLIKSPPLRDSSSPSSSTTEKRKVHFSQEWLKRGEEYNEEKHRRASLSSLAYTGDTADDGAPFSPPQIQKLALATAPDSPTRSKSSLSFTYSLDGTDGSSSAGRMRYGIGQEIKFTPRKSSSASRLVSLPKIDEKNYPGSPSTSSDSAFRRKDAGSCVESEETSQRTESLHESGAAFSAEDQGVVTAEDGEALSRNLKVDGSSCILSSSDESSGIQPSSRDLILQRRKRLASPETNSILHQDDSSMEESKREIIPNTILVEHGKSKSPGDSQKDDSPGSISIGTLTTPSGSEHGLIQIKQEAQILELDGMSLIERDGQVSSEYEDSFHESGNYGEYGYPHYPKELLTKEESSKCTSDFSRRSEDLPYRIPKHQAHGPADGGYRCSRNRVVVIIVIAALVAVGASATVVALLLFQPKQGDAPPAPSTPSNAPVDGPHRLEPVIPLDPTPPKIGLMASDGDQPSTESVIDGLLSGSASFENEPWIKMANDTFLHSVKEANDRDISFALSGNGQFLVVGVPYDNNVSGLGAGALFLYRIDNAEVQWGLVGLLLGKEEGSGFGSNVALSEDGSSIVVTSLGNTTENLVQVFKVEQIEEEEESTRRLGAPNNKSFRSLHVRKHEELYTHRHFTNLVHNVNFISQATDHPTITQEKLLHASVSVSNDGTIVSVLAAPVSTSSSVSENPFVSVGIFQYDNLRDTWIDMKIVFPVKFDPLHSWASSLAGDGLTFAYSGVARASDEGEFDSFTNHVTLLRWNELDTDQKWMSAESFSAELTNHNCTPGVYNFGHDVSLNVDGTALAIGAPSDIEIGYTVVLQAEEKVDGTKVWIVPGKVFEGTSYGFGSFVDLSADGQRLVIASPDHSVSTGGLSSVFQFNADADEWEKVPNFYLSDPANVGVGASISSDGKCVATGIGVNITRSDQDEEEDNSINDNAAAFIEVYKEESTRTI